MESQNLNDGKPTGRIEIALLIAVIQTLERIPERTIRRGKDPKIKVKSPIDSPDWELSFPEYCPAGGLQLTRLSADHQYIEYRFLPGAIVGDSTNAGYTARILKQILDIGQSGLPPAP